MAIRFNVYLGDEEEAIFLKLVEDINNNRRREFDIKFSSGTVGLAKYKPVSKSEVIQQLLKKAYKNERKEVINKLDYYCRMKEEYEQKLSKLNRDLISDKSANIAARELLTGEY